MAIFSNKNPYAATPHLTTSGNTCQMRRTGHRKPNRNLQLKTFKEFNKGKEKIVKLEFSKSFVLRAVKLYSLFFLLSFTVVSAFAQPDEVGRGQSLRVAFYNVENFFDPYPDTTIDYNEFTPEGVRHWTDGRYEAKQQHIFKVITALGGWEPVALMGFAEIENRRVLEDLINSTPLKNDHYRIVHFESHDHRGIDVGAIYLPERLTLLHAEPISLKTKTDSIIRTRDILYMKFLINGDTLHVFFNHWPSRYGGLLETKPLRHLAASVLKSVCDSVCRIVRDPDILIMGDFNDDPTDESIRFLTDYQSKCGLVTLVPRSKYNKTKGTLKYGQQWNIFDQVIVSVPLLNKQNKMSIVGDGSTIFDAPFLLEEDEKNQGVKLKRTYYGFKYMGGYSDHLPVYVDIYTPNQK